MPGALCLALALGLRWGGPALLRTWSQLWADGLAPRSLSAWAGAGELLAWSLGGAAVVVLAVMGLSGRLAPVDRSAGRGLAVTAPRSWLRGALALLVPVVAGTLMVAVCAGAARAIDASEAGLLALWWVWLWRVLAGIGGLMVAAGTVDLALARHRLWRALHRSAAELRRGEA